MFGTSIAKKTPNIQSVKLSEHACSSLSFEEHLIVLNLGLFSLCQFMAHTGGTEHTDNEPKTNSNGDAQQEWDAENNGVEDAHAEANCTANAQWFLHDFRQQRWFFPRL